MMLGLGTGTNGKKLGYVRSHAPGARLRLIQIIAIWSTSESNRLKSHQAVNVHKHQRDVFV
jgi:hypothetical protein